MTQVISTAKYNELIKDNLSELLYENGLKLPEDYPRDVSSLRNVIKDLLVKRSPSILIEKGSKSLLIDMDKILAYENSKKTIIVPKFKLNDRPSSKKYWKLKNKKHGVFIFFHFFFL